MRVCAPPLALHARPAAVPVVQRHQVLDNVLLDLLDLALGPSLGVGRDPEPLLAVALHKDDLVLARLEQVADDDLVPVALEGASCFRDEDCRVGLELRGAREKVREDVRGEREERDGAP